MPERHLRLPALLFLLFAFLGGAALAAENGMGGSTPALPADLSPEQAEMARKYLESNPEARKALEAAQQQKEQGAREGVKTGGRERRGWEEGPRPRGGRRRRGRERGPVRRPPLRLAGIPLRLPPLRVPPQGRGEEAARPLRPRSVRPPGQRRRGSRKHAGGSPGTSSAPATRSSSGCGAGWRGPSG